LGKAPLLENALRTAESCSLLLQSPAVDVQRCNSLTMYHFFYLESIMRDGNPGDIFAFLCLIQQGSHTFLHCGHYIPHPQIVFNTITSAAASKS